MLSWLSNSPNITRAWTCVSLPATKQCNSYKLALARMQHKCNVFYCLVMLLLKYNCYTWCQQHLWRSLLIVQTSPDLCLCACVCLCVIVWHAFTLFCCTFKVLNKSRTCQAWNATLKRLLCIVATGLWCGLCRLTASFGGNVKLNYLKAWAFKKKRKKKQTFVRSKDARTCTRTHTCTSRTRTHVSKHAHT